MNTILRICDMKKVPAILGALLVLSGNASASDTAGKTQVLWLGQSAVAACLHAGDLKG
jgi:hypothetical protein